MSEAPYCPPIDGAYTLILVYELNYMVGCCKKRDNGFRETKVHFSVAVQAEGGAALLHVDPGSFHHLLQRIPPPLWLSSSLWQEGREEEEGEQFSFKEMMWK